MTHRDLLQHRDFLRQMIKQRQRWSSGPLHAEIQKRCFSMWEGCVCDFEKNHDGLHECAHPDCDDHWTDNDAHIFMTNVATPKNPSPRHDPGTVLQKAGPVYHIYPAQNVSLTVPILDGHLRTWITHHIMTIR